MKLQVRPITEKNQWENFCQQAQNKTFLNSWNWGVFYNSLGNKIWRLGVYDGSKLLAICLAIKKVAKRGTHIFVPHGPIFSNGIKDNSELSQIAKVIVEELAVLAKTENCTYLKISPTLSNTKENINLFAKLGFIEAAMFVHPEISWILNLEKSEDELLSAMRKTTRYMIRQAQKSQVEIIISTDPKDIAQYNELYLATVARHDFIPFSQEYLEKELAAFSADKQVEIFFAKHNGKIVSGAIIIYWQKTAYYHQGASDNSGTPSKSGASYLLQWQIIKRAKELGCTAYNFWGIVPQMRRLEDLNSRKFKNHPWYGLSLFKMGFGGGCTEYMPTMNKPIGVFSWLSFLYEKLERIKKRL